ncbi:GP46-like surface antigen, putative [Bodo saltans]|uniref:GP46-like surface antigen, putative n=1 Tax=Bodo saltans TaxID=75058 RepID=A0A0S4JD68_BODSA|nr:GP46-like surface antigen, putative [Bodo saltans]|eukprot:CUG88193.1 GP46-like surface antigen, putative [Bodo saltans]
MTDMENLQLYFNTLTGTLPDSWSSMTRLQLLLLNSNNLSGTLPSLWSNMPSLQQLRLDDNSFTGTLPATWQSWSGMMYISLRGNSLNGTLPASWSTMTVLSYLYLSYNSFSGSLPSSWSNMIAMQNLNLQSNSLSGSLPSSWSSMTALQTLYLSINRFTGSLPSSWSSMTLMVDLDASVNSLSGTLGASWQSMTQLQTLNLSTNTLTGTLPPSWSAMATMETLYLFSNKLTGSLPSSWSNMTLLVGLQLNANTFSSTLPASWSSMAMLQTLCLHANSFSGSLPPTWSNMTALQTLQLHVNTLTGTLPPEWSSMSKVQVLYLYFNRITGALPGSWRNMSQLLDFQLQFNTFSGSLPDAWSGMTAIRTIAMYSTNLSGTLPSSWSTMTRMGNLQLYKNALTGTLPSSWSSMINLQWLFLHSNSLSGTLPSSWSNMRTLQQLHLESNRLSGTLPSTWRIASMFYLFLHANSFSGTLPASWSNMYNFRNLFLNSNSFSGSLPSSWSNLISMQILYLQSNNLTGSLPSSWSSMTQMTDFQLYSNSFTGTLPNSWSRMTAASVQLGSNCLKGPIPASYALIGGGVKLCNTKVRGTVTNAVLCAGSSWPSYCAGIVSQSATTSPSVAASGSASSTAAAGVSLTISSVSASHSLSYSKTRTPSMSKSATMSSSLTATSVTRSTSISIMSAKTPSLTITTMSESRNHTRSATDTLSKSISLSSRTHIPAHHKRTPSISQSTSLTSLSMFSVAHSRQPQSTTRAFLTLTSVPTTSTSVAVVRALTREQSLSISFTAASRSLSRTHNAPAPSSSKPPASTPSHINTVSTSAVACHVASELVVVALTPMNSAALLSELPSGVVVVVTAASTQSPRNMSNGSTPTVSFDATPVPRLALLSLSPIGLNITLGQSSSAGSSGGLVHWKAANVTHAGLLLNLTTDAPGAAPWSAVVLQPPSGGLNGPTPLLTATVFRVGVTMACDGDAMLQVVVTIPAPGAVRAYAEQVENSGTYSQIVSIAAGGLSTGSALGRMMATRSTVLCDADSAVGGGVVDLDLNICGSAPSESAAATARSAIVSNVVLIGVVACVFLALVVLWAWRTGSGLADAAWIFCLPSSLLPVWTVVVPSTVSSATLLLARVGTSECRGTDVALGVVGLALSLVPCTGVVLVWHAQVSGPVFWECVPRPLRKESPVWVVAALQKALRRAHEWVVCDGPDDGEDTMGAAWVVLLEYRDLPYGAVDAFVLAAVSCVSVVSGLTTSDAQCRGWSLAVVALLVVQLALLVALRPFTTIFSSVYNVVTLVLTILSSLSQLVFVWAYSTDEGGLWLVDASSGLSLTVVGVSAVKMLVDAWQGVVAVRRRLAMLCSEPAPQEAALVRQFSFSYLRSQYSDHDLAENESPMLLDYDIIQLETTSFRGRRQRSARGGKQSAHVNLDSLSVREGEFWDSAGAALGTELTEGISDVLQVGEYTSLKVMVEAMNESENEA